MIWLYLSALIFGAAFVLPMLMGGLDFGGDAEFDFDADADIGDGGFGDADVGEFGDADVASTGALAGVGDFVSSMLSFRSMVFFAAFFGLTGTALTVLDTSVVITLIVAVVLGLFASGLNTALFRYVLSRETDSTFSNADLSGRPAHVVLPMGPGRKGRIRVDIGGQPQYLVALPFGPTEEQYDIGTSVVVVEIENATALVAPLMELEGEEL